MESRKLMLKKDLRQKKLSSKEYKEEQWMRPNQMKFLADPMQSFSSQSVDIIAMQEMKPKCSNQSFLWLISQEMKRPPTINQKGLFKEWTSIKVCWL